MVSWSTKTGEPQSTAKLVALSQYTEQVQDTKVRLMLIMFVLFYLSSMLIIAKRNNPNGAAEDRNQSESVS